MIRLILILLLVLVAAFMGIALHKDPGYLLITFQQWSLETSLAIAVLGLLIIGYILHLLFKVITKIVTLPHSVSHWMEKRRAAKAQAKTRQGLIEFSEGYWKDAKNHLIKALPDADTPLLNYLTAARAAQELGENKLRDDYLRQAQQSVPEAKIAVELTQAQLQLANKQFEQALATLKHLKDLNPRHPYVLKLLMHLYDEISDYKALRELLPELKSNNVITKEKYKELEKQTYITELNYLIKNDIYTLYDEQKNHSGISSGEHHVYLQAHEDIDTNLRQQLTHTHSHNIEFPAYSESKAVEDLMQSLPHSLKNDIDINILYAQYLLDTKQYASAEKLLRKQLKRSFDKRLVLLYGQLKGNHGELKFVENLNKQHPHCADTLLTLARLSKEANLWGKTKIYLQESLTIKPSKETYLELGLLLEELDELEQAKDAFKKGLLLEESSL